MAIIAIYNHSPEDVKNCLDTLGFTFEMWEATKDRKKGKKDVIYGFLCLDSFLKANIKTTPILFEVPSVMNNVGLNTKVVLADSKRVPNGIYYFTDLDKNLLKKHLKAKFKSVCKDLIVFRKHDVKQCANQSEITKLLNSLLLTLPVFTHNAFMVAFSLAIKENSFKDFKNFLKNNRLITNQNKTKLEEVCNRVIFLTPALKYLIKDDKNKFSSNLKKLEKIDKTSKLCIKRIRFYLKYWGTKDLSIYMDDENNINYV